MADIAQGDVVMTVALVDGGLVCYAKQADGSIKHTARNHDSDMDAPKFIYASAQALLKGLD